MINVAYIVQNSAPKLVNENNIKQNSLLPITFAWYGQPWDRLQPILYNTITHRKQILYLCNLYTHTRDHELLIDWAHSMGP